MTKFTPCPLGKQQKSVSISITETSFKGFECQPVHCRNYNQDTDEEEDEEDSEEEDSEEDEEDEEDNDYKAMGHSCEYWQKKMMFRF